jgi:hypothetical protein
VTNRLTFARVNGAYRVPLGHGDPEAVRRRLDAVAREQLPAACGRALEAALKVRDPAVYVLRRLDSSSEIDLGQSDTEIGAAWADDITGAVVRAVASGAADTVMRFADADSHAAAFAAALASDGGWSAWYFEPFADLRALPRSAALRATIRQRGTSVAAVLRRLAATAADLDAVVSALDEPDAAAIVRVLADELGPPEPAGAGLMQRLTALAALVTVSARRETPAHLALRLAARALAESGVAGPALMPAAAAVAAWRLEAPAGASPPLVAPPPAGAVTSHPPGAGREVAAAQHPDRGSAPRVVPPHGAAAPLRAPHVPSARPAVLATPLGGAFLLLDGLLQLPDSLRSDPALRHLLLRKALGIVAAEDAAHDPALLLLCGIDEPPAAEALAARDARADAQALRDDPAAGVPPADVDHLAGGAPDPEADAVWSAAARIVLTRFSRRLPGFGTSSARFLRRNLLGGAATIDLTPSRLTVTIARVPLSVLLSLGGFDGLEREPPWLELPVELRLD